MTINIFEGARRIAKLAAVLWLLGWIAGAAFHKPSPIITIKYLVLSAAQTPARSEAECGDDGKETVFVKTKKETGAWAELCFRSEKISDSTRYYRFSVDRIGSWNSPEVTAYTAQVKKNFVLLQADENWIDGQWWFGYLT